MTGADMPRLLADVPAEVDLLGGQWEQAARALAAQIRSGEYTPLTIGVFGRWGSGKTTLMRLLETELRKGAETSHTPLYVVRFNPWEYQNASNLIAPLAMAILRDADGFRPFVAEVSRLWRYVVMHAGGAIVKKATADAVDLEELMEKADWTEMEPHVKLKDEFRNLARKVLGKTGRLVVLVDDLDRCLPDTALALMEAVKLFLEVEGCIYVIGATEEMMTGAVLAYYRAKQFVLGRDFDPGTYLHKIVPVQLRLPEPDQKAAEGYVSALLKLAGIPQPAPDLTTALCAPHERNPRLLKRRVNGLVLMRSLWPDSAEALFDWTMAAKALAFMEQLPGGGQYRSEDEIRAATATDDQLSQQYAGLSDQPGVRLAYCRLAASVGGIPSCAAGDPLQTQAPPPQEASAENASGETESR